MYFSNRGIVRPSRFRRGAKCTAQTGPMHPLTGTCPGIQVLTPIRLKWANFPHFSYESPAMDRCSPSLNSCTRLQRGAGPRKSRALKWGCAHPGLALAGVIGPGIFTEDQSSHWLRVPPAPVPRGSSAQRAWRFPPNHPATVPGSVPATLSQQLRHRSPRPMSAIPAIQSIQSG